MFLKLSFLSCVLVLFTSAIAEIEQRVGILQKDEISASDQFYENNLEYLHQRGINRLVDGQYEDALIDFNHTLNALYDSHRVKEPLFGAALWGRLFSHAYANQEEEAYKDLSFIRSYFGNDLFSPDHQSHIDQISFANEGDYRISFVTNYENPNERLSADECKNRVRGTANVMRILATKIPNRAVADAVNFTITELEYAACRCCERNHWTECLSPIVDSWKYLKKCLDKGVAIAPKLAGPGG